MSNSTTAVRFVAFTSQASVRLSEAELAELLRTSRRWNLEAGITGMLLHRNDGFAQFLEGEPDALEALQARIREDSRHFGVSILAAGRRADRNYADWPLGFASLEFTKIRAHPDFRDFLEEPVRDEDLVKRPARCRALLRTWEALAEQLMPGLTKI